jgi:translocation and assembly module TamA
LLHSRRIASPSRRRGKLKEPPPAMNLHSRNFVILIVLLSGMMPGISAAELKFTGLDDSLEKNARALVALASAPCDTPEWRVERLYRDADQQIRNSLEALGYYRYSLEKTLTLNDGECWQAQIAVEPGAPVLIRDVEVNIEGEAGTASTFTATAERPLPGNVLNHGAYENYKRSILSQLTTNGYFEAEVLDASVTVDESLEHADIKIRIDSGPRYRFGAVEFSKDILTPELLAGYLKFSEGDYYDAGKISDLYESLTGSSYFSSVSIVAEPVDGRGQEVPVIVKLAPAKRRVYTTGVGFATDTGLQGRLGYTNRRRNDHGHQFDARLFLSQVDSELTGTYRWPRGRPDAEWVAVYGGFLRKRTDTSRSDKTTVGARIARNRTENWLETPYIDFSNEEFLVADQLDVSRLTTPGIMWESTIGRELRRVPRGRRMSLDLRGAHDKLLSDTSFFQATASAKWITPLGGATRLLVRADLGTTVTENLEQLPATVRYFTGGDTTVRGYGFETIGPVDDTGQVTGGKHLAVFSLEADWLVAGNWAVAAFADTGSAFNDSDIDFRSSVGVGLHWYSPVGPIRVDVGYPLNNSDENFELHITFGPDL